MLMRFAELARVRGDDAMVERCVSEAARLAGNIEANAWDPAVRLRDSRYRQRPWWPDRD